MQPYLQEQEKRKQQDKREKGNMSREQYIAPSIALLLQGSTTAGVRTGRFAPMAERPYFGFDAPSQRTAKRIVRRVGMGPLVGHHAGYFSRSILL